MGRLDTFGLEDRLIAASTYSEKLNQLLKLPDEVEEANLSLAEAISLSYVTASISCPFDENQKESFEVVRSITIDEILSNCSNNNYHDTIKKFVNEFKILASHSDLIVDVEMLRSKVLLYNQLSGMQRSFEHGREIIDAALTLTNPKLTWEQKGSAVLTKLFRYKESKGYELYTKTSFEYDLLRGMRDVINKDEKFMTNYPEEFSYMLAKIDDYLNDAKNTTFDNYQDTSSSAFNLLHDGAFDDSSFDLEEDKPIPLRNSRLGNSIGTVPGFIPQGEVLAEKENGEEQVYLPEKSIDNHGNRGDLDNCDDLDDLSDSWFDDQIDEDIAYDSKTGKFKKLSFALISSLAISSLTFCPNQSNNSEIVYSVEDINPSNSYIMD